MTESDLKIVEEDELDLDEAVNHQEEDQDSLYDSNLIEQINFAGLDVFKTPIVNPARPSPGLRVRALNAADFDRGFLKLLSQLTSVGDISRTDFLKRFRAMKESNGTYYVTVIEDEDKGVIIGAATLVVEKKFIHDCATRGIIEEVVVSDEYRGRQLGKVIVATLVQLAKHLGCYKITLNCTDTMIRFYTGLGFKAEPGNANFLMIRVPH